MADTGGIAALMKALNETPTLGGGLNKSSGVSRSAKTATIQQNSFVLPTNGAGSLGGAIRTAATKTPAASAPLPKILTPEGRSLDPKAPRGSYLNMLV